MEQALQKEFPYYGFQELCKEVGETRAHEVVQRYQAHSKQHLDNCPQWFLHDCWLLRTYQDPNLEKAVTQSLLDRKVSVFYAPISNLVKQKQLTVYQVADLIRGNAFAKETQALRTITDKKENSKYKRSAFSYATFSGTFSARYDDKLLKHSGLICIDLDHLNDRLSEIRATLAADPATVMYFTSPNGDGLKVVYEMDPSAYTQEQHYHAYSTYLSTLLNLDMGKIDSTGKNISRACFLPCDPSLFINPYFERK